MTKRIWLYSALLAVMLTGCEINRTGHSSRPAYGTAGPPLLFDDMGEYSRPITTSSTEAQQYFNQGLIWFYSFNNDDAVIAFKHAAELDPGCAMAWWGVAYAQGPTMSEPHMSPDRWAAALAFTRRAVDALDDESAVERGLVQALEHRYAANPTDDRYELDLAFAQAMNTLRNRFPHDSDVATIYAESLMIRHPWQFFRSDGTPAREETYTIVETVESTLASAPDHPGANHLYIHAIEASNGVDRGKAAADRLSTLVPASGHMVHMPAHIYIQVGMWDRALEQGRLAVESDRNYRKRVSDVSSQHGSMSHNAHLLAFSAMMVGREEEALAVARSVREEFPEDVLRDEALLHEPVMCAVYDVLKRFGRWDELLAEPAPPEFLPLTTAMWRAHRAVAFAAKHEFEMAQAEHGLFREAMQSVPRGDSFRPFTRILLVSEFFIEAEIALQKGQFEHAVSLLEQAAVIEDTLGYGEPPWWLQPVRHTLGVVYLKANDPENAERVYREDLAKWPGNGWSLLGLAQALDAKGDIAGARKAREEYGRVWASSEFVAGTSCQCVTDLSR